MLRDYQIEALSLLRSFIAAGGRRALLVMPTGAGKTTVFCEVLKSAAALGNEGMMVVRGRKLVSQASDRLKRECVSHSVIMGSDTVIDQTAMISCASVDTLFARQLAPKAKIIVIDEAHLSMTPAFDWLLEQYPDAYIIAVTATPFHPRGFRHIAETIISPTSVKKLISQRYLVPARYFVPSVPELKGVKRANGDYVLKDLAGAMDQARLFAPIVETWIEKASGRATLLFAVNISHSRRLSRAFNEKGVPSKHIDSHSSDQERREAIDDLTHGRISVLCNVGLLGTGVDIPIVSALVLARPTLSYNLHMQMIGRGSRPHEGKDSFIVLDHAGNVPRHGFYETPREFSLDGKPSLPKIEVRTCSECFCTYSPIASKACPGELPSGEICGNLPLPSESRITDVKIDEHAKLVEALSEDKIEANEQKVWIAQKIKEGRSKGHKKGWAFFHIKTRYGPGVASAAWGAIHAAYA